jgi:hypothetical protein
LAEQAEEKLVYFVIPSEATNRSSMKAREKKERFLAPLGMTKMGMGSLFPFHVKPVRVGSARQKS